MLDQSNGLRFDIYERIHLPVELPGIAELEEVELLPDIRVIQREDRAELYGQLLLTGLYRSEDDRTQRLEHSIPVEITVPLTRVSSLEDIGVEIENFDIDLLTMRTVNITGVLSLRGIGTSDIAQDAVPEWQQEEYTVAYSPAEGDRAAEASQEGHGLDEEALYENSVWTFGEGATENSLDEEREEDEILAEAAIPADAALEAENEEKVRTHSVDWQALSGAANAQKTAHVETWPSLDAGIEDDDVDTGIPARDTLEAADAAEAVVQETASEAKAVFVPADTVHEAKALSGSADKVHEAKAVSVPAAEGHEAKAASVAAAVIQDAGAPGPAAAFDDVDAPLPLEVLASQDNLTPAEEKPDLKIALGSKKEEGAKEATPLTFSSLLGSSFSRKDAEDLKTAEAALQSEEPSESGNKNEWKSRFISSASNSNMFRKVRLCIVQREETLDTIAEKYQLSARELGMYNRLSGQNVEEGQVLYIP